MADVDTHEVARTACEFHRASQRPDELACALTLLAALEPAVIVEIGCDAGGTLWAWRQICDEVYGITLPDNSYATGGQGSALHTHGANVYLGDSHDPQSLAWLRTQLDGRPIDALVIDGDHTADGVRSDVATYGPLVRNGGVILLHDIYSRGDSRCEVWQVWPEFAERLTTSTIGSETPPSYGWGVVHVGEPWRS